MSLRILLTRFFGRHRSDLEIEDEIASHLALAAAELRAQGMSAEDAARQARVRFGGATQQREAYRRQVRPPLLDSIAADLRYAARQLRRNPGFAIVAVLTLALGIGATTAIYSLVQAVLLRSLPYGHAEQLVYLYTPNPGIPIPPEAIPPTNADFRDIRRASSSFSTMTQFTQAAFNLSTVTAAARVDAAKVDAQFFSTLEVTAQLGRAIESQDIRPGHDRVAVISQSLWHAQFHDAPDTLSRSIVLDGSSYRIIGVMPPGFQYPSGNDLPLDDVTTRRTDLWIPLVFTPQEAADRADPNFFAVARLRSGMSIAQAQAETRLIMQRLDKLHSADLLGNGIVHGWTALVESLRDTAAGPVRRLLWLLLAAVSCVLLVACGNAAGLLLARAAARGHEFGVRATLGAGRGRIVRQMLTESLLLSTIAGAAGLALAWIFLHLLLRLDPGDIPRLQQATLDRGGVFFAIGLVLLTCLLFGALPAVFTSRIDLISLLRKGGARGVFSTRERGRRLVIVSEIALVTLLLVGAGLILRSYVNVIAVHPGFSRSTMTFEVALDSRYNGRGQAGALFRRLLEKIARIPGVVATGATAVLPFSNAHSVTPIWVEGYGGNRTDALIDGSSITPDYFSAMATPLVSGRSFTDADGPGHPEVVIVNQSFARKYFPGQEAVGKRLRNDPNPARPWKTIIGVVADVHYDSLDREPVPQVYTPLGDPLNASIAVRSSLPPEALIPALRKAMRSIDPSIALADVRTMQQVVAASTARRRFQTTLLTIFAAAALLLALVGLYGLLAYAVRRRIPEIGVRIALGASRPRVIGMVVRQGLRLVVAGLMIGLVAAFACVHLLASMLYGVRIYDPWTFIAAPLTVIFAALLACGIPAWHAAHIEPVQALRNE